MTLQDLKELFEMEITEEDKARFADSFWTLFSRGEIDDVVEGRF